MSWIAAAAELQHDWNNAHAAQVARLLYPNLTRWSYFAEANKYCITRHAQPVAPATLLAGLALITIGRRRRRRRIGAHRH